MRDDGNILRREACLKLFFIYADMIGIRLLCSRDRNGVLSVYAAL